MGKKRPRPAFLALTPQTSGSRQHWFAEFQMGRRRSRLRRTTELLPVLRQGRRAVDQELTVAYFLDGSSGLLGYVEFDVGASVPTITRDIVALTSEQRAARVVLCSLRLEGAAAVPRESDWATHQSLGRELEAVGVELFDHLIVGDDEYYSFRELGTLWTRGP